MQLASRAFVSGLIIYSLIAGATFDGVLNADRRLLSVVLIGVVGVAWLWSTRRWRWHRTALDQPILLWCAAFTISTLANAESWRRTAIGLWYMGLYIAGWYLLQEALANRRLRREWLVDALIITGVPTVFVGFAQVQVALVSGLSVPRPVGTLGNANALAAFLVILLPLITGRLFMARRTPARVILGVYGTAVLLLILLSFSRGGWLGAAAALATWATLSFPVRQRWAQCSQLQKASVGIVALLCFATGSYVIIQSFGIGGRSLEFRTWIYATAVQLFAERPLTGSGLFTFGAGLSRHNSLPPFEPHSHAHNIILQSAAELGIVGLVALVTTGWIVLHAIRRAASPIAIMGAAAFAGVIVHHLVDLPSMMPALALMALLTLALFMPTGVVLNKRQQLPPLLVGTLLVALAISGLWNALSYRQLISALRTGIASGEYHTAANQVFKLSESDPGLAVYAQQAGLLLGLAAERGEEGTAQAAIDQFRRYTTLEPSYSTGWANLAALYFQAGAITPAADAMRRAVELSPQSWSLVYRYGVYSETAMSKVKAQEAYAQALALNSNLPLLPEWDQSPIRRSFDVDTSLYSAFTRIVLPLENGNVDEARHLWHESGYGNVDYSNTHVIRVMLALAEDDRMQAETSLPLARQVAADRNAQLWVSLGAALLDPANFDAQIDAMRLAIVGSPTEVDWPLGANINYIQYLSLAIPRQFLPQVGYSETDIILLHLFDDQEALSNLRSTIGS